MNASLYQRLGGADGIRALVDDVVALHLENPAIQARFRPYLEKPDKVTLVKQHTCEFFEAESGGPAQYTGRSMREAHQGMNISEQEYLAAMDDIVSAMDKHGIDQVTKNDVIAILYSLKGSIIRV